MSPDEWMEVYRKLVYWELELQDTGGAMDEVLKMQKVKKVQLVPFCPEVTNMMRNEWVKRLQQAGYKVTVESRCLSEQKGITDLFEQHVRHAEKFRRLNAKEQKIITR